MSWLGLGYRGPLPPIAHSFQPALPGLVPFSRQEAIVQLGMRRQGDMWEGTVCNTREEIQREELF